MKQEIDLGPFTLINHCSEEKGAHLTIQHSDGVLTLVEERTPDRGDSTDPSGAPKATGGESVLALDVVSYGTKRRIELTASDFAHLPFSGEDGDTDEPSISEIVTEQLREDAEAATRGDANSEQFSPASDGGHGNTPSESTSEDGTEPPPANENDPEGSTTSADGFM